MSADLIERLRRIVPPHGRLLGYEALAKEAADRIEALEAENARLLAIVADGYPPISFAFKSVEWDTSVDPPVRILRDVQVRGGVPESRSTP